MQNVVIPEEQQLILKEVKSRTDVAKLQRRVHLEKGEDPFHTLNTHQNFYFILHGKIKLYSVDLATAKSQTLYMLSNGDMFDILTLLDGREAKHIGEVLESTELIELPLESVQNMILEDNHFRQYFLRLFS